MFPSSYFWFLVTFGDEDMKILHNLCLHFARQDRKKTKRNSRKQIDQNTKNQKTKIWDEQNITFLQGLRFKFSADCLLAAKAIQCFYVS